MKKFETGTYEYMTFTTGRIYSIEIKSIKNGYATLTIDGGKEKTCKIETKKGGANDGNEYIVFRPRYHDCITPDDKVTA